MASVWGELKRRNVVKVAVTYAIAGWLLVEVSSTVFPIVQLPDWTVTFVTMLILLGFPIALILSWAYEITPDGMKRSHEVPAIESMTQVTGRKIDFAIIGALVLALGFVVYNYVLLDREEVVGVLPNSVAVIPFENMSADPEDAYYAPGIHEEILNQLVKLSALNVIARTSVLQYANTEKSIPEIAQELNVETVMEGSVRYSAGQIRITIQLNDGVTGAHLWSETYTRDFEDIFAIESDVAMNVANALEAEFSLEEQQRIEEVPTDSIDAYGYYLAALEFADLRDDAKLELLDRAVEADPDFALAHAARAFTLASRLYYGGFLEQSSVPRVEAEGQVLEAAAHALNLNADLGQAYSAQALIHETNWRWADASEAHARAVRFDPNSDTLQRFASLKRRIGEYEEGVRLAEQATELDPANNSTYHLLGIANMYARNYDPALAAFEISIERNPENSNSFIGRAIAQNALGRTADAVESLQAYDRLRLPGPTPVALLAMGYASVDRPAEAERFLRELEDMSEERSVGSANLALAYLAVGDDGNALRWFEQAIDDRALDDSIALAHLKANTWRAPLLDTPAFQQLRTRVGAF